ncbi:MAG: hypothetical protein GW809_02265 [Bacteroidetes bacterium]|nr:hypothetical protein [Bacteroidota bacterium]
MRSIFALLFLVFISFKTQAQTTHIVDNNDNGIGDFSTLSAAISAASSGDILLLVPSVDSYGDLTVSSTGKQLTIAGGGANGGDASTTLLGAVKLEGGNTANTNLDGFVLGGFVCKSVDVNFVDNVKIKAVRTTEVITSTTAHIRIRNSENAELEYFSSGSIQFNTTPGLKVFHGIVYEATGAAILDIASTDNFIISNCAFNAIYSGSINSGTTWLNIDDNSVGNLVQNIVGANNKVSRGVNFGPHTNITNTIFLAVHLSGGEQGKMVLSGGSSFQNNTFFVGSYGGFTNNTTGGILTISSTEDEDHNILSNPSIIDYISFKLPENSTAKDSGSGNDLDGTVANRGIYGGLDPMPEEVPSIAIGVSVVPTISKLRLSQPTAVTGGKVILKVTGKAKKN